MDLSATHSLNLLWIAIAVAVPPVFGVLAAYPAWRAHQPILGNLTGTTVIFAAAIGFIAREHAQLYTITRYCLDQGFTCFPNPTLFTRYAIYAFIALIQVMVLFLVSLKVEHTIRRSGYDPEWR